MIITKLQGGIGNQMFQYAIARKLALMHNTSVWLNTMFYEDRSGRKFGLQSLNVNAKIAGNDQLFLFGMDGGAFDISWSYKALRKLIHPVVIKEQILNYDINVINNSKKYTSLIGYWQAEKYFLDIRDELLEDFKVKELPAALNAKWATQINSVNAVSIHIRRGDYVKDKATNVMHGFCGLQYYVDAIEIIKNKIENPVFFVFSDDMEWAKNNLKSSLPVFFVENNPVEQAHEDMRLMSLCKHNIIANSTFSWWAAWLNNNTNKIVIAPKLWFADEKYKNEDLIPDKWLKL